MSPPEQHLATRCAAGLFDFSFMSLAEFSGATALERLQTRRLADLAPGRIAYTLLLNEDGSVFNDATLWRIDAQRWWLFTGRRSDLRRLGAAARDRSGEHAVLALQGPASGAILARVAGEALVRGLAYFRFVAQGSMLIARLGYSGELGYELVVPSAVAPGLRQALLEAGRGEGLCECSFAAADSLRIESGYVLFEREIDGRANPRELGLQRLVERSHARFVLSRRLVGLELLDRPPRRDLPLAQVTSECLSPILQKRIALGFAPPDARPGSGLRLADGRAARAARLPFYDPGRRLPGGAPL